MYDSGVPSGTRSARSLKNARTTASRSGNTFGLYALGAAAPALFLAAADEVGAELAARRLDRDVGLASGDAVLREGLHAAAAAHDRALGQAFDEQARQADALAHLGDGAVGDPARRVEFLGHARAPRLRRDDRIARQRSLGTARGEGARIACREPPAVIPEDEVAVLVAQLDMIEAVERRADAMG